MQAPQVLKRAERGANGRILHNRQGGVPHMVAPPILVPKVARVLSVQEHGMVLELEFRQRALTRDKKALLVRLGLNPNGTYRFTQSGEVLEHGKNWPAYD